MRHPISALSIAIGTGFISLVISPSTAFAADPYNAVSKENVEPQLQGAEYWTAERFKAARPMTLPLARAASVQAATILPDARSIPQSSNAHAPSAQVNVQPSLLYVPDASMEANLRTLGVEPQASGTYNTPYTSTRVFPLYTGAGAGYSADHSFPYRAVGKLFFSINGSPYVCSASVIQRRVVATAGHCVHSGTAAGFYSNFVFVPAFRDGAAPFKQWKWRYVTTTGTWAGGGGGVPNAADYAMIEFADQAMTTGGALTKLGNVTGWLGWQTLSLNGNHTSKLGYPCNLDSCQKMQNVTSSSYRAVSPNNVEYGSDARGGSSGGPWVQNFEEMSVGGGTGNNVGKNRVVGITSYGYISTDPKVQGASILDNRWVDLWNRICARAGNCN